ncbi:MAG: hypothetical protein Q4A07_11885, partial [Coriobacteriales bacterium]|nr:hypothetical protein [Coriobacteriales bacterium]
MKRLLCAVLSAVLVVSLVPSPALAELADELEVIAQGEVVPPADAQAEPSLDDVTDDQVNAQAPEGASEEKPSQDPLPQEESQLDDAVEVQSSEDGDAVLTQSVTEPTNIWLEQYADYYDEPSWTSNTYILEQSVTFRIRASNMENGDEFSADAYLWQNAAPTITFVSTTDPTVTYDVPLREGGTYIDGLFSQMDGSYVPLPAGSYTVIFTGEGGQQYSTSAYDNGTYTVDAGIVFRNYYGANAAGQLTRDALVVKPAGGTESLETLPLGGKLDLSLSVRALSAIDELGAPSSCYLYMYGAQDAQGNALTLDQLEAQYASGQTDDWPNPLYWNDTHTNERIVWERVNATTGSNGTGWSLGSSEAGSKEGSFAIRNIDLSIKDGTNPSIEPGVYFPVLKVKMGDQTYRFAYNPVEVATANTEQVAPTIVTQSLPSAMRGTAYATTLVARSGAPVGTNPGSMTWSIT